MPEFDWSKLPLGGPAPAMTGDSLATAGEAAAPTPSVPQADAINSLPQAANMISLHPGMQLLIEHNLHGEALDAHNLCVVVGTLTRERWRDGTARTTVTALGSTQGTFQLAVQEVVGDELSAALNSYRMPLSVSARLLESGLFASDGQRVAVSGPLRLERSYDRQFAADDLDAGLPIWETRLDAITAQAISDDVPDGSWVQLEGEIDGAPIVRTRPIGPGAFVPFASVRVRSCRRLPGAFARSRARYSTSVIVPLEVPLDGMVEQAGALLKHGNLVRIEGRLTPYAYRRRSSDAQIAAALTRLETAMRARGGAHLEGRVRTAQQRLLNVVQIAVGVGYVELREGTALTDEEIAHLIAERPRRVRQPGEDVRSTRSEPDQAAITAALDVATNTALGLAENEPLAADAPTTARIRPRRRARGEAESAAVAPDDA